MSDQRGRLLVAALGLAGLPRPPYDRALWARFWLDSWRGIGAVERGMARQGYDLQETQKRHVPCPFPSAPGRGCSGTY